MPDRAPLVVCQKRTRPSRARSAAVRRGPRAVWRRSGMCATPHATMRLAPLLARAAAALALLTLAAAGAGAVAPGEVFTVTVPVDATAASAAAARETARAEGQRKALRALEERLV